MGCRRELLSLVVVIVVVVGGVSASQRSPLWLTLNPLPLSLSSLVVLASS